MTQDGMSQLMMQGFDANELNELGSNVSDSLVANASSRQQIQRVCNIY